MNWSKRSILIADDEALLARNYADLFSDEGWIAKVAFSVESALSAFRNGEFDVVMLDKNMPMAEDGFRVLHEILRIRPDTCVIFLTGKEDIASAVRALQQGATNFLTKGIPFAQLVKIVEHERVRKANEIDCMKREKKAQAELEARKLVNELAYGMAHQIRNRLQPAGFALFKIEKELRRVNGCESIKRSIQVIKESAELADMAIRRLLRYAKAEELECVPVHLHVILEEAIRLARFWHSDKTACEEIEIRTPSASDFWVMGDKEFLIEAFEVVVDNSIEAIVGADRGDSVQIEAAEQDETIRVLIEDNGPGFPVAFLERNGPEPFRTTKKDTNFGFGLVFAGRVFKTCGGEATFRNRAEHSGACVEVVLPAAKAQR